MMTEDRYGFEDPILSASSLILHDYLYIVCARGSRLEELNQCLRGSFCPL